MSINSMGFFINKLSINGPGKKEAELIFTDGLNVVSGASDTGKSFALSCIDFAFGAKDKPREIPEVMGYNTVSLLITARDGKRKFLIERTLAGGDVNLTEFDMVGNIVDKSVIPLKHNAKDPNTLSGVLLGISSLWGKQVRKNSKGDRRSLSFRDVAYLCVVDEERIIAERPPHLSGSYIEQTVESEVFRMFVNGNESEEVIAAPVKVDAVGIDVKIEFVATMIESARSEFLKIGLAEDTIDSEFVAIEMDRKKTLEEYERTRINVSDMEALLMENSRDVREVQSRLVVVDGLISRFQLLQNHYESNLKRLATIEETGLLLAALPSQPCPVCGAPPGDHDVKHSGEQFQSTIVQTAAAAESKKVNGLKSDLSRVIADLIVERNQLKAKYDTVTQSVKKIQTQIDVEMMPRIKETNKELSIQNSRRDLLLRGKEMIENISRLRKHAMEIESMKTLKTPASPKIPSNASTAEMDAFSLTVEEVLKAWKYPNSDRVIFSEKNQDLVIGGTARNSHGKGVRALTCAAFIISIMKHCRVNELPHPDVVILDSPLVAYREPDSVEGEDKKIKEAGVKDAFYITLASGLANGQVIIFENEDPPIGTDLQFTHHHFTKTNEGRYGLFPESK